VAAISKAWADAHPEIVYERGKAWAEANHDHLRDLQTAWRRRMPERVRMYEEKRRAAENSVESTLTPEEWVEIKETFGGACAYCLRTDAKLEKDHVIAITRGGPHTKDNVVPACRSCNSAKLDRPIFLMASKIK
jgi:5-methylcytosine-specific restriction endonuclease McrA